ncbi:major facilitator superfamily domain-containing protein [Aspergillus germanicus]
MSRILPADDATTPLLRTAGIGPVAPADEIIDIPTEAHIEGHDDASLVKWNEPRINISRVFATFFSFIIVGANDGTYGLGEYYSVDYAILSLVFLSPCIGYTLAALGNSWIHAHFGQRGVAFLGSGFHLIAYGSSSLHPPYPFLVLIFVLAGLGNGLLDAAWNVWIGGMADSSKLMGFLHGFYGLGAALAPLTATSLISQHGQPWYKYYYFMAAGAFLELLILTTTFWSARATVVNAENHAQAEHGDGDSIQHTQIWRERVRNSALIQSLQNAATWIICVFIFIYSGVEIAVAGWIFTFLVDQRGTSPFRAGVVNFLYWAGLTLGRVILGFVTNYLHAEESTVMAYLLACVACHSVFSLVHGSFAISVTTVTLLGFFLGPLFPESVITLVHLLPKELHIAGIGIAVTLGSAGGCVFPFIIGTLANVAGIGVLPLVIFVMLVSCSLLWFFSIFVLKRRL